jgi:hypothetical protein
MTLWQKIVWPVVAILKADANKTTAAATVVLALATLILAVISIFSLERTEVITKQSERAWVSPLIATLGQPLEEDKVIRTTVFFANSGKQPAFDVVFAQENGVVKEPMINTRLASVLSRSVLSANSRGQTWPICGQITNWRVSGQTTP